MTDTRVRETSAPWYIRQAEFNDVVILLSDRDSPEWAVVEKHHSKDSRYVTGFGSVSDLCPKECGVKHYIVTGTYEGDSLEGAEAAFEALERKLLAGELGHE